MNEMLLWLILTFFITCFFTVFAACLYWSMDKLPWQGLFTAFTMALVGIVMMLLFQAFRNTIEVATLSKFLYSIAMIQALVQWAIAWKKMLNDANRT